MEDLDACPLCGVPGQTCVGTAPPPHHVIGADIFPSLGHEDYFVVESDVWEERTLTEPVVAEDGSILVQPNTIRVKIATKGDSLRMSDARRLGLLTP